MVAAQDGNMSTRLTAAILAGGRGERLGGVIKANIEVGGIRLLERVSAALGSLPAPVLVAHGGFAPEQLGLLPGQIPVADLAGDYGGPLAGVAGAVAWCLTATPRPDWLLTVAVDTPLVPADFAARMLEALDDRPAVVVRYAGQAYPTNAIWRLSAIANLPADVTRGTAPHSLKRLADTLGATILDWPETATGDPFANVNTPDDLAALEARARAS
jgi:molybdopterin-guanine dinucleotide biosynthesis protein A